MYDELKEGDLDVRICFRCKGLAVVDYAHIAILPQLLRKAKVLLMKAEFSDSDDADVAARIQNDLTIYESIIESMAIDGRQS